MSRKKIAIIHHVAALGGGTKSLLDLVDMLKDNFDLTVILPQAGEGFRKKLHENNVELIELSYSIPIYSAYSGRPPILSGDMVRAWLSLININKICKQIERLGVDVLVLNSIVLSIIAPFIDKKIRIICIDRETIVTNTSKKIYRLILDNNIYAVGFIANIEKEKLALKKCKTFLIPDSVSIQKLVDTEYSQACIENHLPIEKYKILFMGGSSRIKGLNLILEAANRLDNNYLFVIAGTFNKNLFTKKNIIKHWYSKSYREYFYSVRKELRKNRNVKENSENNVLFVGNRTSVDSLICACDVIVFPSTYVHQPRPCIEAGYYHKPVILSDYKETEEYFINKYNALTFKPNDVSDLVSKIQYAKENKELMRTIGEKNYLMSTEKHNYEQIKRNLNTIILDN